jgi:prophage maintenance system killer protein
MPAYRLDLAAIETSLRELQAEFPRINEVLQSPRDHLSDSVIDTMMAGYAAVDRLIADGIGLLTVGHLHHLLDLNSIVLCGNSAAQRKANAKHLAATEARFWEQPGGGVRDIVEWYEMHRRDTVWRRAAGVYIRVLSEPQLYIEGNHRTGALIMSYLLVREGKPPFVLSVANARAYFDPSTAVTKTHKKSLSMLLQMPKTRKYFADLLEKSADPRHLRRQQADPAGALAGPVSD